MTPPKTVSMSMHADGLNLDWLSTTEELAEIEFQIGDFNVMVARLMNLLATDPARDRGWALLVEGRTLSVATRAPCNSSRRRASYSPRQPARPSTPYRLRGAATEQPASGIKKHDFPQAKMIEHRQPGVSNSHLGLFFTAQRHRSLSYHAAGNYIPESQPIVVGGGSRPDRRPGGKHATRNASTPRSSVTALRD